MHVRCLLLGLAAVIACGGGGDDEPEPPFPEDYAATYTMVRDCRRSGDHDLSYIRVFTDPQATPVYNDRDQRFPAGSVVVKEEYDFADGTCSGPIAQWTAMVRLAEDRADGNLGWAWSQIDRDGNVVAEDLPRCFGCHSLCLDEVGHDATCAEP